MKKVLLAAALMVGLSGCDQLAEEIVDRAEETATEMMQDKLQEHSDLIQEQFDKVDEMRIQVCEELGVVDGTECPE